MIAQFVSVGGLRIAENCTWEIDPQSVKYADQVLGYPILTTSIFYPLGHVLAIARVFYEFAGILRGPHYKGHRNPRNSEIAIRAESPSGRPGAGWWGQMNPRERRSRGIQTLYGNWYLRPHIARERRQIPSAQLPPGAAVAREFRKGTGRERGRRRAVAPSAHRRRDILKTIREVNIFLFGISLEAGRPVCLEGAFPRAGFHIQKIYYGPTSVQVPLSVLVTP